jgi:hypothetical protein
MNDIQVKRQIQTTSTHSNITTTVESVSYTIDQMGDVIMHAHFQMMDLGTADL